MQPVVEGLPSRSWGPCHSPDGALHSARARLPCLGREQVLTHSSGNTGPLSETDCRALPADSVYAPKAVAYLCMCVCAHVYFCTNHYRQTRLAISSLQFV